MSLPTLTAQAQADLTYVVNQLLHAAGNDLETPGLGDEANKLISRNYAAFGYSSQVVLNQALLNKPKQTLLRIVLYFGAGTAIL